MVNLQKISSGALIFIAFLGFCAKGYAFGTASSVGTVTVKKQVAWVERDGKKLSINSFGMKLKKNDIVKTAQTGQAQITLDSGSNIYVAPSTQIQMSEEVIGGQQNGITKLIRLFYGKVRARIQKTKRKRVAVVTKTATIGVKGTEFITEYVDEVTKVGTLEGLVSLASLKSKDSVDIPPGKMGSVSPVGELMPVEEFAGELMEGVEFAGEVMEIEEISGEKIEL